MQLKSAIEAVTSASLHRARSFPISAERCARETFPLNRTKEYLCARVVCVPISFHRTRHTRLFISLSLSLSRERRERGADLSPESLEPTCSTPFVLPQVPAELQQLRSGGVLLEDADPTAVTRARARGEVLVQYQRV